MKSMTKYCIQIQKELCLNTFTLLHTVFVIQQFGGRLLSAMQDYIRIICFSAPRIQPKTFQKFFDIFLQHFRAHVLKSFKDIASRLSNEGRKIQSIRQKYIVLHSVALRYEYAQIQVSRFLFVTLLFETCTMVPI